jgi:FtsZ-interacting cell division protein YlmF
LAPREPAGSGREVSGFTRESREGSGGGAGFGSGGGGADAADAYVVFKKLKDFAMATQVAERMTEGKIVILNLESCDDEIARRVLDFVGGVAYACSGLVKRIAGRVFIITPNGVNADGEFLDEARSAEASKQWYDD